MKKKIIKRIIFSLQEAFISLVPYFIIRSSCTLLIILNDYYHILPTNLFQSKVTILYNLFPILLTLSISMHIAKNLSLHRINFTLVSLFGFFLLSDFFQIQEDHSFIISKNILIYSFIIPILLSVLTLKIQSYLSYLSVVKQSRNASLSRAFDYLPTYLSLFIISLINTLHTFSLTDIFFSTFSELSIELQGLIHVFISHILWLLGIHGTTTYKYIFDMHFYTQDIYSHLPYENFFSAFMIFGGAGSTISLIIAVLISKKDKHSQIIAKSSIPFSIFNMNEIIIYGLPIAFNRNYIIPFILTPILNFILSITLIEFGVFTFDNIAVPWTTPPLISGYLLTGSIGGSLWQLFLILLGVFIYLPFCKNSIHLRQSINNMRKKLSHKEIPIQEKIDFDIFEQHQQIEQDSKKIKETFQDIFNGELIMYYQPQINTKDETLYGFEALVRLSKAGQIYPPTFLHSIEKSGLESHFDLWILKKIKEDILLWSKHTNFLPLISINIYPKTLLNEQNIDFIIELFQGYKLKIEVLEKSLSIDFEDINKALDRLISHGFEVTIDDYGTENSNLSLISVIHSNSIKLDKSLLKHCSTPKGRQLFYANCSTFKKLGFHIIAEGIETQKQLQLSKECNIDVVQGWLYSKALPLSKAMRYVVPRL